MLALLGSAHILDREAVRVGDVVLSKLMIEVEVLPEKRERGITSSAEIEKRESKGFRLTVVERVRSKVRRER